jgi:virginiamycin B lyase
MLKRFNLLFFLLFLPLFPYPSQAVIVGEMSISPIGTLSGLDSGLASDYSANIWFVKTGIDEIIGRITPSGEVTSFFLPGYGDLSGGITVGPDGNIWYTKKFAGGIVGRLEPHGTVTEFAAGIESPRRITTGPDGCLWYTGHHYDGRKYIVRMTVNGDVTAFDLELDSGFPVGITAGPDGNLWFAVTGANKIGRITPAGRVTYFTTGKGSFDITSGPDGNLWFTEDDTIGRITPTGVYTGFPIPTAGSYTYGIAAGPDGHLWFADYGNNAVGSISTSGAFSPLIATPSEISAPQDIVLSPDGLLWFTYSNYNKIGLVSQARVEDYFPLNDGSSWTYQVNGTTQTTHTVSPGTFLINNVPTKRIQESDGSQTYYTNDGNGIREHKEYDPAPPAFTMTLNPPFKMADSQSALGVPLNNWGTASGSLGTDPFSLPYGGSSTIIGIETVNVPAGVFQSVRVEVSLSLDTISTSQTVWIAESLGIVKLIDDFDTNLLVSTNVSDTNPDRFWFPPKYGVEKYTWITSAPITITGITAAAGISISGGQYKIDDGIFTASDGTVTNGQSVTLRVMSAKTTGIRSTAELFIDSAKANFQVFTSGLPGTSVVPSLVPLLF